MTDRKDINDPERVQMEKEERTWMDEMKQISQRKQNECSGSWSDRYNGFGGRVEQTVRP